MPGSVPRIYWDSNVFLAYINGTADPKHDPTLLATLDTLLDQASNERAIEIVTSTVTIAEVAYAITEQTGKALDPAIEAKIDDLWADKSAVTLIDAHQLICRDARNLTRKALQAKMTTKLRGADMIHLATAMREAATEVHSLEPRWYPFSSLVGVTIRAPFAAQQRFQGLP